MYIYATRVFDKVPNTFFLFFFFFTKNTYIHLWKTIFIHLLAWSHGFIASWSVAALSRGCVAQCWLWDVLAQLRWQCHNGINTRCDYLFVISTRLNIDDIQHASLAGFPLWREQSGVRKPVWLLEVRSSGWFCVWNNLLTGWKMGSYSIEDGKLHLPGGVFLISFLNLFYTTAY